MDYFRITVDHRLLFGSRVGFGKMMPSVSLVKLMQKRMHAVFPDLDDFVVEYA